LIFDIASLFPTPVYVTKLEGGATTEELNFVNDIKLYNVIEGQNFGSKEFNIIERPELKRIKTFIETHIKNFSDKVLSVDNELLITISWLNRNPPGTWHYRHSHSNSLVSGVFYFNDPVPIEFYTDKTVASPGTIKFHPSTYNTFNSNSWELPVEKSMLILFPSYIEHCVKPNTYDHDRISLSFNVWTNGKLGHAPTSDYINLDKPKSKDLIPSDVFVQSPVFGRQY
jgi:uncharacterized protein (TIGR02466 family)